MNRIYLDNAATSWPKPQVVYEAVDHFQRKVGASAGRGSYRSGIESQRVVSEARASCARLLGIPSPNNLIFTSNGTASLNLAIHGLLRPGDHVVTTVCEHNSVLRPLQHQSDDHGVEATHVNCDAKGYLDPNEISKAIRSETKLVAITHASNVTGALQPVAEIIRIAHEAGAYVLLDAAQTAGCVPIDVSSLDVDLLACGGHKCLLGPLGTGLLYVREGLAEKISPYTQGGTGGSSLEASQPEHLPEKFEAGNLNVPALAGLGAAASFLASESIEGIQSHHQQLTRKLIEGLSSIPAVKLYGPEASEPRVGVVSCSVEGYDPQEFATALDASCGIECRAGLHCAPLMHKAIGTDELGGLVRLSPGWSTTAAEIDQALDAIAALASTPTF